MFSFLLAAVILCKQQIGAGSVAQLVEGLLKMYKGLDSIHGNCICQPQWHTSVIPVLKRWRWDNHTLKMMLG